MTRAGRRLHVSQSAMSAALARLRRQFDDELLVRSARGYVLTPLARDLLPEVRHALQMVETALCFEDEFDPASSERIFRLAMSDYAVAVISEPLVRLVEAEAPGIRLDIESLGAGGTERALVDRDALIAPYGFGFPGEARPLWRDRMVVLADRRNPRLVKGRLTLHDLATLPHAAASFGPGITTPVDRAFGEHGIERRIALHVFGYLPLPFVIDGTDMVAVVPERLARQVVRPGGSLALVQPAFGDVVLPEAYWFAAERLSDPAHRWFLGRLDAVGQLLSSGGDESRERAGR